MTLTSPRYLLSRRCSSISFRSRRGHEKVVQASLWGENQPIGAHDTVRGLIQASIASMTKEKVRLQTRELDASNARLSVQIRGGESSFAVVWAAMSRYVLGFACYIEDPTFSMLKYQVSAGSGKIRLKVDSGATSFLSFPLSLITLSTQPSAFSPSTVLSHPSWLSDGCALQRTHSSCSRRCSDSSNDRLLLPRKLRVSPLALFPCPFFRSFVGCLSSTPF